eukprot:Pgem_evm1s17301
MSSGRPPSSSPAANGGQPCDLSTPVTEICTLDCGLECFVHNFSFVDTKLSINSTAASNGEYKILWEQCDFLLFNNENITDISEGFFDYFTKVRAV